MAYDRNAKAREKGYANYYQYRKVQSQAKGFSSPYQESKFRQLFGGLPNADIGPPSLRDNPVWDSQVPDAFKSDPHVASLFKKGFIDPVMARSRMTTSQKAARGEFLSYFPDFDWDIYGDWADDQDGESDVYAGR